MPTEILLPAIIGAVATAVIIISMSMLRKPVKCEVCGTEQPKFRQPGNMTQAMMGGFTCKNCGTDIDAAGKKRS